MQELEKKLNYTFRNQELLREALNHSSYANEHRSQGLGSNERLEFLGDSVLGFVTAEYLFARHPDLPEGDLTRIRAALVCEQSLHEVAQKLNLGSYLKLGKGEEAGGGRHRASILADATEAVFAAVYLDGGITAASELIHRVLLDVEREEVVEERRRDYKTLLQEHIQRKAGQELTYCMVREEGPDHAKTFVTEVRLNGAAIGEGSGHSKKESEQMAAKSALEINTCNENHYPEQIAPGSGFLYGTFVRTAARCPIPFPPAPFAFQWARLRHTRGQTGSPRSGRRSSAGNSRWACCPPG